MGKKRILGAVAIVVVAILMGAAGCRSGNEPTTNPGEPMLNRAMTVWGRMDLKDTKVR